VAWVIGLRSATTRNQVGRLLTGTKALEANINGNITSLPMVCTSSASRKGGQRRREPGRVGQDLDDLLDELRSGTSLSDLLKDKGITREDWHRCRDGAPPRGKPLSDDRARHPPPNCRPGAVTALHRSDTGR
jgi:hypothetical protein